MKNLIDEKQLQFELLELEIICKNWVMELDVFEQDINLLKKKLGQHFTQISNQYGFCYVSEFQLSILRIERDRLNVLKDARKFLDGLKCIIDYPSQPCNVIFIESFNQLEREVAALLSSFKTVRKNVLQTVSAMLPFS